MPAQGVGTISGGAFAVDAPSSLSWTWTRGSVKVIVVAHGELAPRDRDHLEPRDWLVAADGGAVALDGMGVAPDLVVGDLDSVGDELLARLGRRGTPIERRPVAKDESDTELAVGAAVRAGADEVVLLGALGGRVDHELANLLLLADPGWRPCRLAIRRGSTLVRPLHGGDELVLEAAAGDRVSLLPVAGNAEGVRTRGLRFALDGERLRFGRSRGLSNEVVDGPAAVSIERGVLLIIETRGEMAT